MAEKSGAVTSERFNQGFTFKDFVAQVKVNRNRFEEYYGTAVISPDDAAFFKRAAQAENGAAKVLVLGEEWCPDVFRGLPAVQRIAEAGGMELRVFPRDANLDIMDQFLNQGKFQSIPTVVFFTKDMKHICHWIERPVKANEDREKIESDLKKAMPGATDQEFRQAVREKNQPLYPAWQQATVKEIRQMLAEKLGIR